MNYVPWKPLHLRFDLDQQVEQLFNELIHEPWGHRPRANLWQPAIDIVETEAAYIVEADLPGILPENIDLRIQDNCLRVRGRRDTVEIHRTGRSVSVERAQGEFTREFKLLHPVNAKAIQTYFENGILRAILPKLQTESLPPNPAG